MTIEIEESPHEIHATTERYVVTVLKDGPAKLFKRNVIKQHNPKLVCPDCDTGLERVQARTSTGALAGEFLYCNACGQPVGPRAEKQIWIVAELNGVRLYAHEGNLILTTQDLNP